MHRAAPPSTEQPPARTPRTPCMPHSLVHCPSASHPCVPCEEFVKDHMGRYRAGREGRNSAHFPICAMSTTCWGFTPPPTLTAPCLSLGHCHCHQRAGLSDAPLLPVMICRAMGAAGPARGLTEKRSGPNGRVVSKGGTVVHQGETQKEMIANIQRMCEKETLWPQGAAVKKKERENVL